MRETHILQPRPPFSFDLALAFLRRFPPTMGDRIVDGERVLGAARMDGQTIGFQVEGAGDVESPALRCTLDVGRDMSNTGDDGLDPTRTAEALGQIGDWLGADDDLQPFYALAEADPPFWALTRRLYGYHQVRFFTPFENTCWAVLGQRTPFAVARAAKRRLMERYGGAATIEGQTIQAFPEPADLAAAEPAELTTLVASERKADRLHAIAVAFAEIGSEALRAMPTDELGCWLEALPGIGPWSSTFVLLRGFGRADAPLPLGTAQSFDRELLQAGRAVYGADLTVDGLAEIAERYGLHRGSWGHYLRIAD
jgi:DNA-3-methyladenine glycosylase II